MLCLKPESYNELGFFARQTRVCRSCTSFNMCLKKSDLEAVKTCGTVFNEDLLICKECRRLKLCRSYHNGFAKSEVD